MFLSTVKNYMSSSKKSTMGTIRINTMMLFFNKWQIILQLRKRMQGLAQQPGQQRDKGHADQGNAAARDQLLHALALY